jgi:chromosome segregation ATPase
MSRETLIRIARRATVLVATGAVIGVAAFTVQLASQWRAAEAPLDTAPVGMTTIADDIAAENQRTVDLRGQMTDVVGQIGDLQTALSAASGAMDGDAAAAAKLQDQLASAKAKLAAMQKQLKGAQSRLDELNRAAARQAALNRRSASGGGGRGEPHETREPRETEEPGDD